jgi:hypothetical protein
MIPVTMIPAMIFGAILSAVLLYLRWSIARDERREGRKP